MDYFTIDRNGVVSFGSRADSEEIEGLIESLAQQGFEAVSSNFSPPEHGESADVSTGYPIVLELPRDCVSLDNLNRLLAAKGNLIKRALGLDELPVEPHKDTVAFPWFPSQLDTDEAQVRIRFITALCKMSKRQKRVTATERPVGSEKYAFRCFLLRLGHIGEEHKLDRKILLKNLTGNSSHH